MATVIAEERQTGDVIQERVSVCLDPDLEYLTLEPMFPLANPLPRMYRSRKVNHSDLSAPIGKINQQVSDIKELLSKGSYRRQNVVSLEDFDRDAYENTLCAYQRVLNLRDH
tara:strand:- start:175 stop:510 length:336 start_codon:yes stop_codon:yes gene_type:complete